MIPGEVGGSETYLRRTLAAMAELYPDHSFTVFGNNENKKAFASDLMPYGNVTLVNLGFPASSRLRRSLREQFAFPKFVRDSGVDVLWNPGNMVPFKVPCPSVATIYDMQYRRHPDDYSKPELAAMRFFTGMAIKRSDAVLTVSEFSRQEIVSLAGAPFDKISVTPLAASDDFSTPLPGSFIADRVMSVLRGGDPYILAVSNSYPHKKMEDAVNAFARIMDDVPHRLAVIGQPRRGEPALEKAISGIKDPSRVIRINRVGHDDLVALVQAAELFVFPSNYEGFGLPVLEAMNAGTPVIACRAGSIPEVGGDTIRYCKPGDIAALADEMKEVLMLPQKDRTEITSRAAERARKFSWKETARLTFETLASAVDARN